MWAVGCALPIGARVPADSAEIRFLLGVFLVRVCVRAVFQGVGEWEVRGWVFALKKKLALQPASGRGAGRNAGELMQRCLRGTRSAGFFGRAAAHVVGQ